VLKVKYFLCSESAAIDLRKSTISAFHIIESAVVQAFPFMLPRISVIAAFERSSEELNVFQITLSVTLGEHQIFLGPIALNFAQQLQTRTVVEMGGLPISSPGKLKFAIRRDDIELAEWSIQIDRLGTQQIEQLPFPPQPN
jgi:hypothetical protein